MLVGYGRTSTTDQEAGIEAQERDLRAAGCEKLFVEQVSSVGQRVQLSALLDFVREGDTVVITRLDRLARSVADLLNIVARLETKKAALRAVHVWEPAARYGHGYRQADVVRDRSRRAIRTRDDVGTPARRHCQGQAGRAIQRKGTNGSPESRSDHPAQVRGDQAIGNSCTSGYWSGKCI